MLNIHHLELFYYVARYGGISDREASQEAEQPGANYPTHGVPHGVWENENTRHLEQLREDSPAGPLSKQASWWVSMTRPTLQIV